MRKRIIHLLTTMMVLLSVILPYQSVSAASSKQDLNQLDTELKSVKKVKPFNEFPKVKDKRVELTSRRTENQKTYLNPNGTFTTEISAEPIHYKDKNGKWEEIDNTLTQEGTSFVNKKNTFKTTFRETPYQKIELDDHYIEMTPKEPQKIKGTAKENVLTYKNIYPHTDFEYVLSGESSKENIILENNQAQTSFEFALKTNLTPEIDKKGNLLFKEKDKVLFTSYKPFAVDKKEKYTEDVKYELTKESDNQYSVKVILNSEWAKDEKRAYPVTIDPTVWYTTKNTMVKDTFITDGYPTQNFEGRTYAVIGHNTTGLNRTLLNFDLPNLPSGANITGASVYLYQYVSSPDDTTAYLHPVTSSWDASNVTWNTAPTYTSSRYLGLHTGKEIGDWIFNRPELTSFIQNVYNGTENYYGFMVKANVETYDRKAFYTGEGSVGYSPRLNITYQVKSDGAEDFWAFDNGVNLLTGNYVTGATDYSLDGKGIPIAVARTYNSQSNYVSPYLGKNWRFNFEMNISPNPNASATMPTTFIDEDGTKHIFVYDNAKKEYKAPPGVQLKFWRDSTTGYRYIEDTEGIKYKFDLQGKLVSIEDKNSNITTFDYDANGKVKSITDSSKRVLNVDTSVANTVKLTGSTSIMPYETVYVLDSNQQLVSVTKNSTSTSDTVKNQYAYTGTQLTSVTDNAGNVTTIGYNAQNQLSSFTQSVSDKNGVKDTLTTSYTYKDTGSTEEVIKTNPKGVKTRFAVNGNGNLIKTDMDYNESTGTAARTVQQTWDENNQLAQFIDPKGNGTFISYDDKGNVSSVEDSKGYKSLMKYDDDRNVTQTTGPSGETLKNYYDDKDQPTSNVSMTTSGTMNQYDSNGNVTATSNPFSLGYNLIPNSGFEEWQNGLPRYWSDFTNGGSGKITQSSAYKVNGSYSMQLTSNGSTDLVKVQSEYIPIYGNVSYNLSWQQTTNDLGTAKIVARWMDSNYQLLREETVANLSGSDGTGWTQQNINLTSSNQYDYYVRIYIEVNGGTILFDNFQLQESAFVNDYNVLTNEGFETDINKDAIPDGWNYNTTTTTSDGIDTTTKHTGNQSLVIDNQNSANEFFVQDINMPGKKGDILKVSGYSQVTGVSGTPAYEVLVKLKYKDNTEEWFHMPFSTTAAGWQYKTLDITAPKDYLSYQVIPQYSLAFGKAWFDDLNVKKKLQGNPMVSSYNIIQNGSFELYDYLGNGANYGWKFVNSGTSNIRVNQNAENSFIGTYSLELYGNSSASAEQTHYEQIKDGSTYVFSSMVNTKNLKSGKANLSIRIYDANKTLLGANYSKDITGTSKDWNRYAVELDVDKIKQTYPTAYYITPMIISSTGNDGNIFFDATRLEEKQVFSHYNYDATGNYLTSETDEEGNTTSYDVDARGNVTKVNYPVLGYSSSYAYDWLERLKSTTDPNGLKKEFIYDPITGDIKETKYYDGNSYLSSISSTYNEFGELLTTIDQLGNKTEFIYDKTGQISDVKQPNGTETHSTYNNLGEITDVSYTGDNRTWKYEYDVAGNISKIIQNGTLTTNLTYDPKNHELTNVTYPSIASKTHKMDFTYNQSGLMTVIQPTFTNFNNNPITYDYYDSGMFKSLVGSQNETYTLVYDEQSKTAKTTLQLSGGKKVYDYYHYSNNGELEQYREESDQGQIVRKDSFTYNVLGNITKITHYDDSYETFEYDKANNLISEKKYNKSNTLLDETSYSYDVSGNRISMTHGSITDSYTYDAANQLKTYNGTTVTHDENGNRTSDDRYGYTYNANDQLTTVKDKSGNTVGTYEYGNGGLRTKKIGKDGNVYYYYYIGDNLSYITNVNNDIEYSFTRDANGRLLTMTDHRGGNASGATYEYVLNYRGDVVGLRDKSGNMVVQYTYDSWGNILSASGSGTVSGGKPLYGENPFRYAGYFYDEESKLYYVNARYYDPKTGGFLTRDFIASDNLYNYVGNNPINNIDPSGMFFEKIANYFKRKIRSLFEKKNTSKNGENGSESRRSKGDTMGKVIHKKFTNSEIMLGVTHPLKASKASGYPEYVNSIQTQIFSADNWEDGTPGNAFRHAYWSGLMTRDFGSTFAKNETNAHEAYASNDGHNRNMDYWNNYVGREIALQNPSATNEELANLVMSALNGAYPRYQLEYLKNSPNVCFSIPSNVKF